MSCLMASKTTLNWPSYFFSICSIFRFSSSLSTQDFPQPGKGSYNLNIGQDGALAIKNTGGHGNSVFGKGMLFEASVAGSEKIKYWVLGWGANARVLEP